MLVSTLPAARVPRIADAQSVNALVVGTTHRYKSKYITTVMYKPSTRANRQGGVPEGAGRGEPQQHNQGPPPAHPQQQHPHVQQGFRPNG